MSLINDALKKADKDVNEGKNSDEGLPPENPEHLQKKAAKNPDEGGGALLLIILMTIVIASGILYWTRNGDRILGKETVVTAQSSGQVQEQKVPLWELKDPLSAAMEKVKEEIKPTMATKEAVVKEEEALLPPADIFEMEAMEEEAQAMAAAEEEEKDKNPEDALIAKIIEVATQRGGSSGKEAKKAAVDPSKATVKTFHLSKRRGAEDEEVVEFQQKNNDMGSPEEAFVESLQITGVMFSGSESKVLMNNRVFSINSIVHPKTGLRLSDIKPHTLIFTDASGREYTRSL